MSKVASYLQEHILGEVSTNAAVLAAMSHDASVLEMKPEMVVYPRVTNDIRKVARFSWQLAEKGHVLPLTARGLGTDETGGAIGKGIIVSLSAHMNRLFEFDAKQKLVRVQPGMNTLTLNSALSMQGLGIPGLPLQGTAGGAVASNASGPLSGKYGAAGNWVHQLEVILANGDVLQTQRLSKRELNKKKGLQTFEGEIYRTLDNLIEDNKQLIEEKIASDVDDTAGYSAISKVKQPDGSFDLAPLFVGSQGTLGIISEMILKVEFVSTNMAVAAIAFSSIEAARDALDHLRVLEPAILDYFDGALFNVAAAQGKAYDFYKDMSDKLAAVILVGFDEFNDRARQRKLKKVYKMLEQSDVAIASADGGDEALELLAIREVTSFLLQPAGKDLSAPPLFDGAYVPFERFEEFSSALAALAAKHHVILPIHNRSLENILYVRPLLQLHKVGDKQKVFKLLEEYATLVDTYGGHLVASGGEGRTKAHFAQGKLDEDVRELFGSIKTVFDPFGILNPGVKQVVEIRQLVSHLRSSYDMGQFADQISYN